MSEPAPQPQADGAPEPPAAPAEQDAQVDRRAFLGLCTAGLGACAGAGVLGVVATAVVGTPLRAQGEGETPGGWVDVGPLAAFPEGQPVKVVAVGERVDAWSRLRARPLGGVLVRREGQTVRVLSSSCPHNGCDVFVGEGGFICPCHDSRFAPSGELLGGESPRGLDPLDARVVEGRVVVRYQRFQVGTPQRRPL